MYGLSVGKVEFELEFDLEPKVNVIPYSGTSYRSKAPL